MRAAILLASAALLATHPALAQSSNPASTQTNTAGAQAQLRLRIGEAEEVGGTAVAGGNAVSRTGVNANAALDVRQRMSGNATADADAVAWHAGAMTVTSAAVANGATAQAAGGNVTARMDQGVSGDTTATTTTTNGDAVHAASSSAASGNVAALSAENGDITGIVTQTSSGSTRAFATADHDYIADQAVSDAIASANNISAAGSTTTLLTDTRQTATGEDTHARVDLYVGQTGDAVGNATANANAVNIDNAWGYVNARAAQTSTSDTMAESYVTLSGDFTGFASASAYGVGNSVSLANVASDTDLDVVQNNSGEVDAHAALAAGGSGDQALASSAAYGNSITAGLCAYCDNSQPGLNANSQQTNSADVRSSATINAQRARQVAASSSAIGNVATYQVSGKN